MKKLISLILVMIMVSACSSPKPQQQEIFTGTEESKYVLGDIILQQKEADKLIQSAIESSDATFDNPTVFLNPYKLTPLSALIVFNTNFETEIDVEINDKFNFTSEKSNKHAIAIYGLFDDFDNLIVITDDNGNTNSITITTKAFTGDKLVVETSQTEKLNDDLYFLSPNFVENCIYDKYGNLVWYIIDDYAGDIEFLDNGHFLISDPHQGTNGVKINYASFLEIDYLGKIYKQYITEFGYHHEIVILENGDFLTTGANDDSPFLEAVLYIMDGKTAQTKFSIDMYEKLHSMSPEWVESLGDQFDFVLNSIDYDPATNDVLLSFRGIGVITRMNLDTQEFKWMFGDEKNLPDELSKYLLKVLDDTKYPYGEHSAFFTEDGNVSFHNNDADQFHMDSEYLVDYLDNYTTNVVLEIDEENMTVRSTWESNEDQKEFSKVAGMLLFMEDGHKLITYGYSVKHNAYDTPEIISINDANYLNGIVIELDENDETLFKATLDGLIFRTFKSNFYTKDIIDNYVVEDFVKIDGNKYDEYVVSDEMIEKLNTTNKYEGKIDILVNRLILDYEFNIEDEVKVVLINKNNEAYSYVYKVADKKVRVFNSGRYGIKVSVPNGHYKAYVFVNDVCYNTDTVFVFGD